MAYIYQPIYNKIDCEADPYSDSPLYNNNTVGINVTRRFRIAIRWGFWMAALNVTRAAMAQIALRMRSWTLLWGSYVLFVVNFTCMLILFILMNLWRWDKPGRVCSGEFLTRGERMDQNIAKYYLIEEGLFLKVILIILYSMIGLGCYSVCFAAIFLSQKKSQEQLNS